MERDRINERLTELRVRLETWPTATEADRRRLESVRQEATQLTARLDELDQAEG